MALHYIDIDLRPDPEFATHHLLSALYGRLHRALVELKSTQLRVSFPGYALKPIGLGQTLRLIGGAEDLAQLMARPWLAGVADHVQLGPVQLVPPDAPHRRLQRVQAKSSPDRLRRRQMKRHGISAEEAARRIPDSAAEQLHLPFITMHSASTGQPFRLFLSVIEVPAPQQTGDFNAYGLSSCRSIPWF